ncbi:MAG: diaminopimelate decarboxylase [Candidatus Lokiarchaeota archaeon]|nr:diaminopimelate decarboxylase [Candidatus Lokiarchaeota archaeon]
MEYKKWLEYKNLKYVDNKLYFDERDVIELAEKYGTPLYILNEQRIRKQYRDLKKIIDSEYKRNEIHYSVKANSHLVTLKILKSEGAGVDCTSAGEIYASLQAGFPNEKIIYTGNMFTNDEFKYAVDKGIHVNLDSISQLKRLVRIHKQLNKDMKTISFRINPEFGAGHHSHTITAGKEIKFGILDNQVLEAYTKAKEAGFTHFGTHMHIGSGILDPEDYKKPVEKYLEIINNLGKKLNIHFEFIDFGGSIGIPYKPNQEPFDLEAYKENLIRPFAELVKKGNIGNPVFKFEPGRFMVAESSIIITQINTIKDNGFKKFVGVNAGFNTLLRPAMYNSYHHIIPCKNSDNGQLETYNITGPICESGDILGKSRELPILQEEDYLAILDTGAYGFTMSSVYNSRPRSSEVLINGEYDYLIRKRETNEDLLKKQLIPSYLK